MTQFPTPDAASAPDASKRPSDSARPGTPARTAGAARRKGLALCLSGGGFRASLFHLGALRYLHDAGVLPQVTTIASVSGGSILAGYLAGQMIAGGMTELRFADWESDVSAGFRKVAGRDLRTWPMIAHALWNWAAPRFRAAHLTRRLEQRLTPARLQQLPAHPRFVFCASDLVFGVNWTFRRNVSGDYQAGYTTATRTWPLARAVAASACFPPVFGPMPVGLASTAFRRGSYRGADRARLTAKLTLSDGGVYDNLALEPVWKSHAHVLVSDCGAPFRHEPSRWFVSRLLRCAGVAMNQAAAMRKRAFFADIAENRADRPPLYRGGYWGIGGVVATYKHADDNIVGYSQDVVDVLERVRTDLDRFTDAEMRVLENHGYLVAAAVMRRRRGDLLPLGAGVASPAPAPPHPEWMDEARVRAAMRDSHRRVSPRRWFTK